MASTTITKRPDKYATSRYAGGSLAWKDYNGNYGSIEVGASNGIYFRFDLPSAVDVSAASISCSLDQPSGEGTTAWRCTIYSDAAAQTAVQSKTYSQSADSDHTFSFSSLGINTNVIVFRIAVESYTILSDFSVRASEAEATVNLPTLTINLTPSSLYTGSRVTLDFANRLGRTLSLQFYYQSTPLLPQPMTVTGDSVSVTCPENWFSTAGVSGNSMSVKARAWDDLGRTSSDVTFTLLRPTAGGVTLNAPKNVTKNGNESIAFSWSYSGDGDLTKTELQYSTDNANWSTLATINDSGTIYTAPAYKFSSGTVYWRARVTNSYGLVSGWTSASFTVSFPTLSIGVTPSSLYAGDSVKLSFTNRLGRTLSLQFYYQSTPLLPQPMTVTGDSVSVTCPEDWFSTAGVSGNSMSVKARAWDDLGRTSSDVTFTLLRPTGGSITTTAPSGGPFDGTGTINFAWSYSGDGTLTKTLLEWSTDNAVWQTLATINGSGTTWTAPALKFPGGTNYWRGTATNSLGKTGSPSGGKSFTVAYSAESQVVPTQAPTGGRINASNAQSFSVALEASGPVYTPFTVASATLYWRAGTSGDFTAVSMTASGQGASVTIAGGTFPAGTVQWYAEATDNTGHVSQTETFTLTTLNANVDAAPLSPINTVESGGGSIVFRWTYGSMDGSAQSAADLQFSTDGATWGTSINVPGSEAVYTAPAGTFSSGTVFWRVRAYNGAGTAGPWSEAVSFSVFAAPVVVGVSGTDRPFCTITWQVEGQLAYKLEVEGKRYGPYFGEDVRSFALPEPLEDGLHTVKVAAQNRYGLWSEWAEGQVLVANVPGDAVTLRAVSGESVILSISGTFAPMIYSQPRDMQAKTGGVQYSVGVIGTNVGKTWMRKMPNGSLSVVGSGNTYTQTASSSYNGAKLQCRAGNNAGSLYSREALYSYAEPTGPTSNLIQGIFRSDTGYFLVYRDGVRVAKVDYTGQTPPDHFVDRAAAGAHEYYVLQVIPGGYYTKSNTVTGEATVESPIIGELDGGDFLHLTLSESANRAQSIQRTREIVYTQYAGAIFPEAEIGEHETLTATGDVSYTHEQRAEAAAFEALLGKRVIYKTPGGACVVGVLEGFSRRDPLFFKSYSFSITQMDWEDFADA